ncbi:MULTISPECIES: peptidylprolyl isomerase [Bacillus]|uniref:peptidylprolyl isomerase n=1 Tax=Bacillus TaxID=1386 RepID=UPI0002EA24FE|nr:MULTISPECIES: peptidylprolyl isomerase [Bacillus]
MTESKETNNENMKNLEPTENQDFDKNLEDYVEKESATSTDHVSEETLNETQTPTKKAKFKNKKAILIIGGAVIVALAIAFSPLLTKGNVVATVGGEKIKKEEVYDAMVGQYGSSVVDTLIKNKIIELEAKKENITISQKAIDKELESFIQSYGGQEAFDASLEQSGISLETFKTDIENFLKLEKLLKPSIKITDEEMKEYFEENKDSFDEQEQVKASHILVDDLATAQKIKKELDNGADFAELAKKNSTDTSSAEKGGDLDYFSKGDMVEAFETAAFSLKEGEISDPVKTDYGYHIIKVTGKKAAKAAKYEDHKKEIKQNLFDSKLNEEYPTWLEKKKKEYKITNTLEKE